jgi:hypothetical protein
MQAILSDCFRTIPNVCVNATPHDIWKRFEGHCVYCGVQTPWELRTQSKSAASVGRAKIGRASACEIVSYARERWSLTGFTFAPRFPKLCNEINAASRACRGESDRQYTAEDQRFAGVLEKETARELGIINDSIARMAVSISAGLVPTSSSERR